MKCLLCNFQNPNNEELKNHYICFHQIKRDNYYFKELFLLDTENRYSRRSEESKIIFQSCTQKKNHCYLNKYAQVGGSNNFPLNISKRSLITYYSINYFLH